MAKARRNLIQVERLSAGDPWVLFRVGKLRLENHLSKEAEADFERAAALLATGKGAASPDLKLSDIYLQIAQLRFNRLDYLGARRYLDKVEPGSVEPDIHAAALDLEGAACLALGNPQEALEKHRQAVQIDPSQPEYWAHLIWAELLDGETEAAKTSAEIAKIKWPQAPAVQEMMPLVERESAPERAQVPVSKDWHLKGEGIVCCPCAVPCPCRSNARPTHGHCESTGVIRIAEGNYGKVPLDGLIFTVVATITVQSQRRQTPLPPVRY